MIDRIEALIEKATPGPWSTQQASDFIGHVEPLLPLMLEALKIADDLAVAHIGGDVAEFIPLSDDLMVSLEKLEDYCAEHLPEKEEK
jgi:hypothetical protein